MDAPFHHTLFNQPLTYKALRRLALSVGWSENKTQGKGSHRTFTRQGYRDMTLPCHSESQEYSRGLTRKFLQQILEPLADIGQVSVQGLYSVEQVEAVVSDLIADLPNRVQQEYEKAIAEQKAAVETYESQRRAAIDQSLQEYEAKRLQDCERTIRELTSEQRSLGVAPAIWTQALLLSEQEKHRIQRLLAESEARNASMTDQLHASRQMLQTVEQSLTQKNTSVEQLHQSLHRTRQQVQHLHRIQKRDRILMFGALGISACCVAVLLQREVPRPRSPAIPADTPVEKRSQLNEFQLFDAI